MQHVHVHVHTYARAHLPTHVHTHVYTYYVVCPWLAFSMAGYTVFDGRPTLFSMVGLHCFRWQACTVFDGRPTLFLMAGLHWKHSIVVAYGGLRGALGLSLALIVTVKKTMLSKTVGSMVYRQPWGAREYR